MVQKAEVEIKEKEKSPQEQTLELIMKSMEHAVEVPPIDDVVEKANQAIAQAQKARKPIKQTWYCTDCGQPHIQNDPENYAGGDHISVECIDGEFCDPRGNPLTGGPKALMEKYAVKKAQSGDADHAISQNRSTLNKMEEIRSRGGKS